MTISCSVASTKKRSWDGGRENEREREREHPRSDAMTGFDVPEGAFFLSPGFQVSCGLAARLDNRLGLNVRFERESAWTGYTGTAMQYSELMYDAPTAWALARTSARSFLLIFSFGRSGSASGNGNSSARWEKVSHDLLLLRELRSGFCTFGIVL